MKTNIRLKILQELENFSFGIDENNLAKLEALIGEVDPIDFVDKFITFYAGKNYINSRNIDEHLVKEFSIFLNNESEIEAKKNSTSLPTPQISLNNLRKQVSDNKWFDTEFQNIYGISPKSVTPRPLKLQENKISMSSPFLMKNLDTSTPMFSHISQKINWGNTDKSIHSEYSETSVIVSVRKTENLTFFLHKRLSIISYIDDRINNTVKNIIKYENLDFLNDFSSFHILGTICLEESYIYGRVTTDPIGMRLSSENIFIEGSLDNCRGTKIRLDISNIEAFSFFPGQILVVKGFHLSTSIFEVTKIFKNNFYPIVEKIPTSSYLQGVIFSGPYFSKDCPSLEFINSIKNIINSESPHLIIFIGPFIEENSKINIKSNNEFMLCIFESIYDLVENRGIQVVVIPSLNDITSLPVFPQPALFIPQMKNFLMTTNPVNLNVNGFNFTISSIDILLHLSKFEFSKGKQTDRISTLISHVLNQKSVYPLYPADSGASIDFSNMTTQTMDIEPHLLILTSNLCSFVKQVDNTVCINPSQFYKGNLPSSYCSFQISSNSEGLLDSKNSNIQIKKL